MLVTLFYVFAEDSNFNTREVEMEFSHYRWGYWEFPKKKDINIFDAKYIFYGPCSPSETTKMMKPFKDIKLPNQSKDIMMTETDVACHKLA